MGIPEPAGWDKLPFIVGPVLTARATFVLGNTAEANVGLSVCHEFMGVFLVCAQHGCGLCNLAVFQMVPRSSLGSIGQFGCRHSALGEDEESSPCPWLLGWIRASCM